MKSSPSVSASRRAPGAGVSLSLFSALALAAAAMGSSGEAAAECVCRCVNGTVTAICDRATEVAPVCAPRICPIAPPSDPPRVARLIPPAGTKYCFMAQVLNPVTNQYEWRDVCR